MSCKIFDAIRARLDILGSVLDVRPSTFVFLCALWIMPVAVYSEVIRFFGGGVGGPELLHCLDLRIMPWETIWLRVMRLSVSV